MKKAIIESGIESVNFFSLDKNIFPEGKNHVSLESFSKFEINIYFAKYENGLFSTDSNNIETVILNNDQSKKIEIDLSILLADSKKILVKFEFFNFNAICLFASYCLGKKPLKVNLSEGKPERITAFISAEGPGSTVKERFSLIHF